MLCAQLSPLQIMTHCTTHTLNQFYYYFCLKHNLTARKCNVCLYNDIVTVIFCSARLNLRSETNMKVGELALIEMPIIQSIEGLRTCYFQLEYKKSDMRARLPMHDMSSNSIIVLSA